MAGSIVHRLPQIDFSLITLDSLPPDEISKSTIDDMGRLLIIHVHTHVCVCMHVCVCACVHTNVCILI